MFWPVLIVAVGLLVALAGMVITFIISPPIPVHVVDGGNAAGPDEAAQKREVSWSKFGIWLLVSGTFLQLVGTVWQVVLRG